MTQRVTKNTVSYSNTEMRIILLNDAIRIAKEGGAYSYKDYYNGSTWLTEIIVYWPEEKDG